MTNQALDCFDQFDQMVFQSIHLNRGLIKRKGSNHDFDGLDGLKMGPRVENVTDEFTKDQNRSLNGPNKPSNQAQHDLITTPNPLRCLEF